VVLWWWRGLVCPLTEASAATPHTFLAAAIVIVAVAA
jgi:hypothetical protein